MVVEFIRLSRHYVPQLYYKVGECNEIQVLVLQCQATSDIYRVQALLYLYNVTL